jgi:hypothetical protein
VIVALTGAACVALGAWAALAQGCTVNSCVGAFLVLDCDPSGTCPYKDPSGLEHGASPPTAAISADGHVWESSAIRAPWIAFPAQRAYQFLVPFPRNTRPTSIEAYVSVTEMADDDQWVNAAGNLAEVSYVTRAESDLGFWVKVHNDTCANYYLRVVVRGEVFDSDAGDAGAPDAGADVPSDASADAGNDGP